MSVRYGWRPGSRVSLDADLAGRELERIRTANNGELTPLAVLEQARSSNSALHDHFEWDDTRAAEAHRLGQAGEIIRSITVDISRSNVEPPKPVRAFVSVERAGDRSYTSTLHAMGDEALRRQVLEGAWRELLAIRRKYEGLEELARIFQAIDEARPA
jgi:hypothetical protein